MTAYMPSFVPSFRNELFFLSNMYPSPFIVGTTTYKTSEHFFQAYLTENYADFQAVLDAPDGWAAKRVAKKLRRCASYKNIRIAVMAQALMFKFLAHSDILQKLLSCRDDQLIETNNWHDNFWGCCVCAMCEPLPKQNKLGELLKLTRNYFAEIGRISG
jgi:ribA/ribD-fused uncharacterized protein